MTDAPEPLDVIRPHLPFDAVNGSLWAKAKHHIANFTYSEPTEKIEAQRLATAIAAISNAAPEREAEIERLKEEAAFNDAMIERHTEANEHFAKVQERYETQKQTIAARDATIRAQAEEIERLKDERDTVITDGADRIQEISAENDAVRETTRALTAENEKLRARVNKYEDALKEAESILGDSPALHLRKFFGLLLESPRPLDRSRP